MYSILIVDDERIERDGIEKLIRRLELPFEATQAPNGVTALELLKERSFDVLFTDIKMPLMDGLTLIHQAREIRPDLVTVIFSAYGDFKNAQAAITEHVHRYILKPVRVSEFKDTLLKTVDAIEEIRKRQKNQELYRNTLTQYRSKQICDMQDVSENPVISKVQKIIAEEYMNDLSLEDVAKRVSLNPSYLSTLFARQQGQSFIKYLNDYRLNKSEHLLCDTNIKVRDVAARVGFASESYFISLFKQCFGMSPRAYRARSERLCASCDSTTETGNSEKS